VARGDLGIEIPYEELPIVQRRIVKTCLRHGKPVIVATHMLESMISSPMPTRAEVTDVANAIFEETDAIMLSGETTVGKHPLKCIEVFDRIASRIERSGSAQFHDAAELTTPRTKLVKSAVVMANELKSEAILVITRTGPMARYTAWMRPRYSKIYALCPNDQVAAGLTVSWGVRYDWNGPYHEKWARTVNGFDTADANPLQAAAQAAYAKSPSPYLAASAFNVPGGLTFATSGNTAVYQNMSHIVSPRIGFAWTPDILKGHTVIRGGAGVFASAVTISQMSLTGAYSTNPFLNQTGYSATTTLTAPTSTSTISSTTPTLSSPFPAGFTTPVGSASGMLTSVGGTASFINPNMKTPYSMRWNFGFQHTLTSNTVLEVMYIGNHALHVPVSYTQLNTMPRQYLSTSGLRDSSTTYLTGTTPAIQGSGLRSELGREIGQISANPTESLEVYSRLGHEYAERGSMIAASSKS